MLSTVKRHAPLLCAVALLAGMLALQVDAARKDGVTYDEVYHVPVGYVFLHGGPYFDRGHPPLARYLFALALWPLDLKVDPDDHDWGRDGDGYGRRFLTRQNVPMASLVLRARMVSALLALVLAGLIGYWAWQRHGTLAGLLALALAAGSPDLIAHGHLATNDLAAALAVFAAVPALARYAEAPKFSRALVAALAITLAFLTKFSTLPVAAAGVALLLTHWLQNRDGSLWRKVIQPTLVLGSLTVVMVLVLGAASVGFRPASLLDDAHVTQHDDPVVVQRGVEAFARFVHSTPERIEHTRVPGYFFFKNLAFFIGRSVVPERFSNSRNYLLGEYSEHGFRAYFLVTFLLKTPLPVLLLFGLAIVDAVLSWRRGQGISWITWTTILPAGLYYLALVMSNANIGHRHLLPVYPFLFLQASRVAASVHPWVRASSLGLAGAGLCAVVLAHPFELPYYNALAGPPERSWSKLSDSNIDWGQDLPRLASYQREHAMPPLYADLHATVLPEDEGVVTRPMPRDRTEMDGWLAVSITRLLGRYGSQQGEVEPWAWLRPTAPHLRVGSSILLYHLVHGEPSPPPIAALRSR
jgi:hypothetical protein